MATNKKIQLGMTLFVLTLICVGASFAAALPTAGLQIGNDPVQTLDDWVQFQDGWLLNFTPGGHLNFPHLWPGQTPPPERRRDGRILALGGSS